MFKKLSALSLILAATTAPAQELTPDQLRAMIDARANTASPVMAMLNDPDPIRSLAAVEVMIESGDPQLAQMAIDFGLISAAPEVRRAAFIGFLGQRPTLLLTLTVPENADENFAERFVKSTNGAILGTDRATYSVNVGPFSEEWNCYLLTATERCAVELGPTGISIYKRSPTQSANFIRTFLEFGDPGQLTGTSRVNDVAGGFPTTLSIVDG